MELPLGLGPFIWPIMMVLFMLLPLIPVVAKVQKTLHIFKKATAEPAAEVDMEAGTGKVFLCIHRSGGLSVRPADVRKCWLQQLSPLRRQLAHQGSVQPPQRRPNRGVVRRKVRAAKRKARRVRSALVQPPPVLSPLPIQSCKLSHVWMQMRCSS